MLKSSYLTGKIQQVLGVTVDAVTNFTTQQRIDAMLNGKLYNPNIHNIVTSELVQYANDNIA